MMAAIRSHWQYETKRQAIKLAATALAAYVESLPECADDDEVAEVSQNTLATLAAVADAVHQLLLQIDTSHSTGD